MVLNLANITNITQINSFETMMGFVNTITGGVWGVALTLTIGTIIFIILSNYPKSISFTYAAFVAFIVGLILWWVGLLAGWFLTILLAMFLIGFMYLTFKNTN
jgi:hypothetical protein